MYFRDIIEVASARLADGDEALIQRPKPSILCLCRRLPDRGQKTKQTNKQEHSLEEGLWGRPRSDLQITSAHILLVRIHSKATY